MKSRPSFANREGDDDEEARGGDEDDDDDDVVEASSSGNGDDPNQRILDDKDVFFQSMTLASTYKQRTDLQLLGDQKVP